MPSSQGHSPGDMAADIRAFQSGARWLYWIAAFSLVNSALNLSQANLNFIVGLGVSQVIDAIASAVTQDYPGVANKAQLIGLALNALISGLFVLLGKQALKRSNGAFMAGIVLYALDGLLFLLVQDWLSLGFHVFATVCMAKGYAGLRRLQRSGAASMQCDITPVGLLSAMPLAPCDRYARKKRTTWIVSLCIGLPLPLAILVCLVLSVVQRGSALQASDILYMCIGMLCVLALGAIIFSIPWLVFHLSTRRLRATLYREGDIEGSADSEGA